MSDIMRPMSMESLMDWIIGEYKKNGSIFSVRKMVKHTNGQALPIFDEKIEAPFGPAAGPNTQLAQNIIASYVAGARFFELKTVQILDGAELSECVSKPCITAADECYNCEWSTELYVDQAYEEYVKAWVVCKLLAKEYGLGDPDGFVFNMSVGYDLEGIKSEKINRYIDNMKEAKDTEVFRNCISWALENVDRFENVDKDYILGISSKVSSSITESTLHGCPPDEIERIATYLITEKQLHTYVKCNPTLLGYEYARKTLDSLGYDYIQFDDHHFVEDLQWKDAIPMFRRLMALTKEKGLEFGVKLTNTFPVDVAANELPSEEMYMAGRSLFPLSLHLARLISEEFNGELRISYSGGAVINNVSELFAAGIWPITMATNILKPGGYERMSQIGEALMECGCEAFKGTDLLKIQEIDEGIKENPLYKKPVKPLPERHTGKSLPLFDCFNAPCRNGCPINQDIPAYLDAMEKGETEEALTIILERNTLPFITGTICPHHCGDKCMRNYYEETLHVREMKLLAAESAYEQVRPLLQAADRKTDKRVAVIGGGPAGLSAAAFLSREGIPVTVFEKRKTLGGVVRHVIPDFRISETSIEKDIVLCKAYGAEFVTGREITSLEALKAEGYTDIILAVGAWKEGNAHLKYGEAMDAVRFLELVKKGEITSAGKDVVVLGGGNTAMDVARAAKRLEGVEHVRLVYRRTRRYMPADEEELELAIEDGVEFMELLAPVGVKDGQMTCSVMKLGNADASGRRAPEATGEELTVPASLVIAAIGEKVDSSLLEGAALAVDSKGCTALDTNLMTAQDGIYVIGDAKKGPATVVEAIADAQKAAAAICGCSFDKYADRNRQADDRKYIERKGTVDLDLNKKVDNRCLGCATVCEVCEDVCPNRANVAIRVEGKCMAQIIHVDGMCNECGNCAIFCPYEGRPFKDKFTLFWSEEDFKNSENEGFVVLKNQAIMLRLDGKEITTDLEGLGLINKDAQLVVKAVICDYSYLLQK